MEVVEIHLSTWILKEGAFNVCSINLNIMELFGVNTCIGHQFFSPLGIFTICNNKTLVLFSVPSREGTNFFVERAFPFVTLKKVEVNRRIFLRQLLS